MAHYDIFRDQLGIKYPAFGHALWEPNPGLYSPVEVGDVGFIREGKFHRLFNALLPADHPSHQRFGVPEHYEPLRPSVAIHIDSGMLSPNDFLSYGVSTASGGLEVFAREPVGSADVSFVCSRNCGAVLSLPVTARREDTIARGDFAKWITSHIESWFAFTRRLGLGIEQMEDMVFVTGRHRARSSTNIAFYEGQAGAQVSFGVQVTVDVGSSVYWQVTRNIQGAMLSQGPSGGDLPEDQCIFVRGFRVTRVFKLFPRLRGAAEHTPDPSRHDCEPDSELEVVSIPSLTKYRDPLHVLLEYIAERAPNCDLALVHDDDLDRLRKIGDGTSLETLQPDAIVGCLQRSEPDIAQVTCDSLSSECNIPGTSVCGSTTVAVFSEELSSWSGHCPPSQWQDRSPLYAATPSSPVPVSSSIRIADQTLSPVSVATMTATPLPQPRPLDALSLQSQPLQLQPQPLADEANKGLARELSLWKDIQPPCNRDATPEGLGRFSNVSITSESSNRMRASGSPVLSGSPSLLFDGHSIVPSSKIPFGTAHKYTLKSRGRDYATVIIVSHAPNIQDTPLLHFGDELKGRVILPKDNLSDVRSMEVAFRWFESDPITPSYEAKRILSPQQVNESGISDGQYIWPFVMTPPSVLSSSSIPTAASSSADSPLENISPRGHRQIPRVQLTVTIYLRGRLTRNIGLSQPIHYVPPPDFITTPSWPQQKFPKVVVRGLIFRHLAVEVECQLITPVSYPVSDVIPLRLAMTSGSREALDLFSVSHAIDVRLFKVLAFGEKATNISPFAHNSRSYQQRKLVAKAQWDAGPQLRELPPSDEHSWARWHIELDGRLHRDQSVDMSESFEQPGIALMYFVCLYPFLSSEFRPASNPNKELFMGKLQITKQ